MKNPTISAVLNLFLWGIGYVYNGKRIGLGIGLFVAFILINLTTVLLFSPQEIIGPEGEVIAYHIYITPFYPLALGYLILSIAFAYDGYREAKEIKSK